jgi:hypothetical protein
MGRVIQVGGYVMAWIAVFIAQSFVLAGIFAVVGYHAPDAVGFALALPMALIAAVAVWAAVRSRPRSS